MGHVRDLPSSAAEIPEEIRKEPWSRLGVNVAAGFKPVYVVAPGKREVVRRLKAAVKQAEEVYIATDEDREGESIGWHLVEVLEPRVPVKRMVFHEITEEAIRNALENTRQIDLDLVDAQETRRVLDRLVGYELSPLLWRKIAPKLSAGRVQSVAVRLLVMRERERLDFVSASYWDLAARLAAQGGAFTAELTAVADRRVAQGRDFDPATGRLKDGLTDVALLDERAARALAEAAEGASWRGVEVEEREQSRSPAPPFTTSTLQQEASRKLGLSARETMRVAQSLYENGYITYMRTDSVHLSNEALNAARAAIRRRYGEEYLTDAPRRYKQRSKLAQEAHEAIRPAGTQMLTADEHGLRGVEARLYDLIWKRTVATQMRDARLKTVTARIEARLPDGRVVAAALDLPGTAPEPVLTFRASGRTIVFPGYFRAYVEGSDDPEAALDDREQPLPPLARGATLECRGVEALGHETKPPARYTDASLVKVLESEGIGRPSTYASIIDTILTRGYARKVGQQLVPTFTAFATTNLLELQFRRLVDTEFTAGMEAILDAIAAGERPSDTYLHDFYLGEDGIVRRVEQAMEGIDARAVSTVRAARWEPYVVRVGRYGPYVEGELDGEVKTASLPPDVAPADLTREDLERYLREGNLGDVTLATEPETGQPVLLKRGPFGPYLQLGTGEGAEKPKRVSLPPGVAPHDVTPEMALALIALPKTLGEHPDGGTVDVGIGRFGPYVRHGRTYASLPKDAFVLDVTLEEALELLRQKQQRGGGALRELGVDERTGEAVDVRVGRYGPYVKRGKLNASLPKDVSPEEVTLEQAIALLDARAEAVAAKGGTKRGARSAASKAGAAKGTKRASAKRSTAAKGAAKTRTVKGKTTRSGGRSTKKA